MKNKLLKILIFICVLCFLVTGLIACQDAHMHTYPETYTFDAEFHWHECECGVQNGNETHRGSQATCAKKAVCSTCKTEFGELEPHKYSTTYSFDKTHHWKEVTCGCVIEPTKEVHITGGDTCITCEYPFNPTEGITYDKSADGTYAEVIGYTGSATKVKIADTYQGLPVKNIYDKAFYNENITYIEIPNSVTSIGDSAFYYCDSLTSIEIPNSVTGIGDYAFYHCNSLTSIEIPNSVISIGEWAFCNCYSLTSVVIGDSVTSIGGYAFYNCTNLKFNEYEGIKYLGSKDNPYYALIELINKNLLTYTIHSNTKIIANYAFYDCERLTSITIPNSVTSIGSYAFYHCESLTSVEIGDSVTSVGDHAFYYCTSLISVEIGDSVTSIGEWAFDNCISLTSIEIPNSVTSIGSCVFWGCDSLTGKNITVKDPNGWQIYSNATWEDLSSDNVAYYIADGYELRKVK